MNIYTYTIGPLLLLLFLACPLEALDIPERHELDQSKRKTLVLDNGIKVLLVSDPKFNLSAASLDVSVGSLSDPPGRDGLAHFLEHMLFLGTRKFPEVDEYSHYLTAHGGMSNAYTAGDHTNYHFEVQHEALEGALDRFAQFFITPLFSPEYTEREVKAVNSEHQKNLQDDNYRAARLLSTQCKKNHPQGRFSTGNLETLTGVTGGELKEFYELHYSANRMSLVILSNRELSWMESMARKYFSPVKDKKLEPLKFDPDYLPAQKKLRLIKMQTIKDLRQLIIEFPLPGFRRHYKSKPLELIGFCLGHEGRGSLLSHLKDLNLATALSAGGYDSTADYGTCQIQISLTPLGLQKHMDVLAACFAYIELMKKDGLQDHIFREEQTLLRLGEVYSDKGEGMDRASDLATLANQYPLADAERVKHMLVDKDDRAYAEILSALRPDNMLVLLMGRDMPIDQTEKYYGTRYSYVESEGPEYQALFKPPVPPGLSLPTANPFLPKSAQTLASRPVQIGRDPGTNLWYLQDVEFRNPKVSMIFKLCMPAGADELRRQVLLHFYTSCLQEQVNELAYPASMAGLGYSISSDLDGLQVNVNGYSEPALRLLGDLLAQFREIKISQERFDGIKDNILRSLESFNNEQAITQSMDLARRVHRRFHHSPPDMLVYARKVDLPAVREFSASLFSKVHLQGLVHGNVSQQGALDAAALFKSALGPPTLAQDQCFRQEYLDLSRQPGDTLIEGRLPTNNSCFRRDYWIGMSTPSHRIKAAVLHVFINQLFFTEMRTRQQLGYIVISAAAGNSVFQYLVFLIQSASHPADILAERADEFLSGLPAELEKLPPEKFNQLKDSVREKMLEKPKSIEEKASQMFNLAFVEAGDFDRVQTDLQALDALTQTDLVASFKTCLGKETRRMSQILLYAEQHQPKDGHEIKNSTPASAFKAPPIYLHAGNVLQAKLIGP